MVSMSSPTAIPARADDVPASLVFADGTVFRGKAFGAPKAPEPPAAGEVVFHTGMTGYQEILTDPSYAGQIVCLTCPEIGNVGTNPEDEESRALFLRGLVVRSYDPLPSSWRATETLGAYMKRHGVPGICDVDTRALVRHIRASGAQNAVIAHGAASDAELRERAIEAPSMEGQNLVDAVTCREPYAWREPDAWLPAERPQPAYRVVAYDFGIKRNILRRLVDAGFDVTVVPAHTTAADVLAMEPDGVFLSNGPGDPAAVPYAAEAVASLIGQVPIFGICLGHQILGLALGGKTSKMRFGHHGANQPALVHATGRVAITSENHGFAISPASLAGRADIEITHTNLNDGTVEGIRHARLPVFSVQYHPEASPGPHDTTYLFQDFRRAIESHRA
jgi:carbamoyl-phosphate synthase small subunit